MTKGDLISREALKKEIENLVVGGAEGLKDYYENGSKSDENSWIGGIYDAWELIDNAPTVELQMGRMTNGIIIPIERTQGEWIPVSERLPNRNGVYNVTRKLKEGETIYFISDASYFDGQNTWHADTGINHGRPYLTDIIAWQPLPEPYKEGGAE